MTKIYNMQPASMVHAHAVVIVCYRKRFLLLIFAWFFIINRLEPLPSIFLSHDILKSPDVVSTATRNNVTPTALSETVKYLISADGGDPGRVCLNYSTAYRYKVEVCASIAEDVRKTWTPSPCLSLHWDGKLMSTLRKCEDKIEEHLPVLVTGTTGTKL